MCFESFLSLNPFCFARHFAGRVKAEEWSIWNHEGIAKKAMALLQVPVPRSSAGMLAIGGFAPGTATGACPPGYPALQVPVPRGIRLPGISPDGEPLLNHQNHHRLAEDGYGSAQPPLEPLMSKLPVLTLQP